jgi:hypothetical protein
MACLAGSDPGHAIDHEVSPLVQQIDVVVGEIGERSRITSSGSACAALSAGDLAALIF